MTEWLSVKSLLLVVCSFRGNASRFNIIWNTVPISQQKCIDNYQYNADTRDMEIEGLDISRNVAVRHLGKHNVEIYEVYEVFQNEDDPVRIEQSDRRPGAHIASGRTDAGRYLKIPFILEGKRARILTAIDMTQRERRRYKRRKR